MPRRRRDVGLTKKKKQNSDLKKVGHFFGGVYNKIERWGSGESIVTLKRSKGKGRRKKK